MEFSTYKALTADGSTYSIQSTQIDGREGGENWGRGATHWQCTLAHHWGGEVIATMQAQYSMGAANHGYPKVFDVLGCLWLEASYLHCTDGTFEDWCDSTGQEVDSRRAYQSWEQLGKQVQKLYEFLGEKLFNELMETDNDCDDAKKVFEIVIQTDADSEADPSRVLDWLVDEPTGLGLSGEIDDQETSVTDIKTGGQKLSIILITDADDNLDADDVKMEMQQFLEYSNETIAMLCSESTVEVSIIRDDSDYSAGEDVFPSEPDEDTDDCDDGGENGDDNDCGEVSYGSLQEALEASNESFSIEWTRVSSALHIDLDRSGETRAHINYVFSCTISCADRKTRERKSMTIEIDSTNQTAHPDVWAVLETLIGRCQVLHQAGDDFEGWMSLEGMEEEDRDIYDQLEVLSDKLQALLGEDCYDEAVFGGHLQ